MTPIASTRWLPVAPSFRVSSSVVDPTSFTTNCRSFIFSTGLRSFSPCSDAWFIITAANIFCRVLYKSLQKALTKVTSRHRGMTTRIMSGLYQSYYLRSSLATTTGRDHGIGGLFTRSRTRTQSMNWRSRLNRKKPCLSLPPPWRSHRFDKIWHPLTSSLPRRLLVTTNFYLVCSHVTFSALRSPISKVGKPFEETKVIGTVFSRTADCPFLRGPLLS